MHQPFPTVVLPSLLHTGEMWTPEELAVFGIEKQTIMPKFKRLRVMCVQFIHNFNLSLQQESS